MATLVFGVLTVSDRCFNEGQEDVSGRQLAKEIFSSFPTAKIVQKVQPDELLGIQSLLRSWAREGCDVILTTGGTGFSSRDVTPEATKAVIEKEAPGLAYAMISKGLEVTEMAMLSRAVCGIYKSTLIVNLPGSPKGAVENFGFIKNSLLHALALLKDDTEMIAKTHLTLHEPEVNRRGVSPAMFAQSPSSIFIAEEKPFIPSKVKLNSAASRKRLSPYPMLEVEEAIAKIFKECFPTMVIDIVPFNESLGRVLAEDIYALHHVPPFVASIKDGYAVRSSDQSGIRKVREVVAAGDKPTSVVLQAGEAVRISTGAPLPSGADAVVQVEDTILTEKSTDGTTELSIQLKKFPAAGRDLRQIGSDVLKGELVLKKFQRLGPADIGVLAIFGITEVKVFKRPTVAIMSTGNEVKNPEEKIEPGQIRDCNRFALISFLKKYGYISADCGIVRDEPDSLKRSLEKAFAMNDILITTGGVSMGEFDILKQVLLEDFGAMVHFARVNMKPGKPTTYATLIYNGQLKLFFGLPGNPVSCMVTAVLYVIPTLKRLERAEDFRFPVVEVEVSELKNSDPRPEYHRLLVSPDASGKLVGVSTGNQISSRLNSMVGANGLALVKSTPEKSKYTPVSSSTNLFGNTWGPNKYPDEYQEYDVNHTTQDTKIEKPKCMYQTILFDNLL